VHCFKKNRYFLFHRFLFSFAVSVVVENATVSDATASKSLGENGISHFSTKFSVEFKKSALLRLLESN